MMDLKAKETRILVLAPMGRDALLLCEVLSKARLPSLICQDASDLYEKLTEGAGAVLLTEEALSQQCKIVLSRVRKQQATWSDLPLILLVSKEWQDLSAFGKESNITVLERPIYPLSLITMLRSVLLARQRQYQLRDLLTKLENSNEELELLVQERTAELHIAHVRADAEHKHVSTILESITDAVAALDQTNSITYLNQKAEQLVTQLTGKTLTELVGKTMGELFSGAKDQGLVERYEQIVKGKLPVSFEVFFSPLLIWLEIRVYPTEQGVTTVYAQNVTERKISEAALRSSEQRFSQLFQAAPVAACLTTLEGKFLDINTSFQKLTGYEADELLISSTYDLGMWASNEDQVKLQKALDGHTSYHNLELHIRNKAGEVLKILSSAEIMEVAGQTCFLTMFYDITERKKNEEELMQAIQEVMTDTAWFSRSLLEKIAQIKVKKHGSSATNATIGDLSKRERQVLEYIAIGYDNRQIAADLGLAEQTVRNYITNIYEKLQVHSRADAIIWARERGLVGLKI